MNTIPLPKTQHLVVFQEVIRSGSIGSAAKELGLTQPAVSKTINDIEDYFGTELIVRKNNRCYVDGGRTGAVELVGVDYPRNEKYG
ncbi:Threonine catabolic operon transcriptional activator TdcA [Klebsiella aerogenes]|nr:Threonine catabolic operon transcriptional activator TdcA [Klebsiella aerogenes]